MGASRRALACALGVTLLLAGCGQDGPQESEAVRGDFVASLAEGTEDVTVPRGSETTVSLVLTPSGGFEGTVTLRLDGAPAGVRLGPEEVELRGNEPMTVEVTLRATDGTPRGPYDATVVAAVAGAERGVSVPVRVTLPPGAVLEALDLDRTGLPQSGGSVTLSWHVRDAGATSLRVAPADGVRVGGEPYDGPVALPPAREGATLTFPSHPGDTDAPVRYTVTLEVRGAPGTAPVHAERGVAVGPDATGSVQLDVAGLPDGVDADGIVLRGFGVEATADAEGRVRDLVPGPYELTTERRVHEGLAYDTEGTRRVTVAAGRTVHVPVTYAPLPPSLDAFRADPRLLEAEGGEVDLSWEATSATAFEVRLVSGDGVTGLPQGPMEGTSTTVALPTNPSERHPRGYVLELRAHGHDDHAPASARRTLTVGPRVDGGVRLDVSGLTPGATDAPVVRLHDGNGTVVVRQASNGQVGVWGLAPGTYTVDSTAGNGDGAAVHSYEDDLGNVRESAEALPRELRVAAGEVTDATVAFEAVTGVLVLRADGLGGAHLDEVRFDVEGEVLRRGAHARAEGPVKVCTHRVVGDAFAYTTPLDCDEGTHEEVNVASGDRIDVRGAYTPTSGALQVTLDAPAGVDASLELSGADCHAAAATLDETGLVPDVLGTCTLTVPDDLRADVPQRTVTVDPGRIVPVTVRLEAADSR